MEPSQPTRRASRRRFTSGAFLAVVVLSAIAFFLVLALLMNIFERKQEARNPYVRLVEVSEETTSPEPWGMNWAREYDDYKRTMDVTRTKFGGSESLPEQKAEASPWLTRMFAGYAFALDYRDRRGHAYMHVPSSRFDAEGDRTEPRAEWLSSCRFDGDVAVKSRRTTSDGVVYGHH